MRITDLAGKAVLVTGASTGIGAAVAKGFAAQGARVAVHYNSSEAPALQVLEEIRAAGGDAIALRADVRSVDACQSLVAEAQQRLGALDVLVNNAGGVVKRHPLHEIDDALYDEIVNLNARSVFACSRAAVPIMQAQGGGAIISTTSVAARTGGGSKSTLYAASKAFVSTFSRGFRERVSDGRRYVLMFAPKLLKLR
jgi:3-oxoacyl-[acyl-carrier protein] reductase